MYRFSRQVRLTGSKLQSAMGWAIEMTEHVNSVTGLRVNLFTEVYSPATGTLVWSTTAADLSVFEAGMDKLMADNRYNDLAETGFGYVIQGSMRDVLRTIVYPTEPPSPEAQMPEYVSCTYSTIANGQFARAALIGIEIAQRVTQLTGTITAFEMDATGNYGGVAWLGASASITDMQQAEEKINQDLSFVEYIDKEASTAFVGAGGTTSRILRRVL